MPDETSRLILEELRELNTGIKELKIMLASHNKQEQHREVFSVPKEADKQRSCNVKQQLIKHGIITKESAPKEEALIHKAKQVMKIIGVDEFKDLLHRIKIMSEDKQINNITAYANKSFCNVIDKQSN